MYFYSINNILGEWIYMGNGNFWQLFLGKEPYSKNLILLRHGYCGGLLPSLFYFFKPDYDIKFKKYRYRVKFWVCQILGRYTMSLGWSKYWGVWGYFL